MADLDLRPVDSGIYSTVEDNEALPLMMPDFTTRTLLSLSQKLFLYWQEFTLATSFTANKKARTRFMKN